MPASCVEKNWRLSIFTGKSEGVNLTAYQLLSPREVTPVDDVPESYLISSTVFFWSLFVTGSDKLLSISSKVPIL